MNKAVVQLVKDIIFAVIGAFVGGVIIAPLTGDACIMAMMGFLIPFGWRWSSTVITAVGLVSILIKMVISCFLGFFACPIILVKDVLAIVHAGSGSVSES